MRRRRVTTGVISGLMVLTLLVLNVLSNNTHPSSQVSTEVSSEVSPTTQSSPYVSDLNNNDTAIMALESLPVKGRAPKTNYHRTQFGNGWDTVDGCTKRNIILYRDLNNAVLDDECQVLSGVLLDPYSGESIQFANGANNTIQIDHVVALSDAWQKGAQQLTAIQRQQLANDPLELLAVSASQNQSKGDGDAATWLPKNKSFRCQYVARQIAVKVKYSLWVSEPEKKAMASVLSNCPNETLP